VHSHPAYVIYVLEGGRYRNYASDGNVTEGELKAGEVLFREPLTHAAENIGDKPLHMILVELKGEKRKEEATPHWNREKKKIGVRSNSHSARALNIVVSAILSGSQFIVLLWQRTLQQQFLRPSNPATTPPSSAVITILPALRWSKSTISTRTKSGRPSSNDSEMRRVEERESFLSLLALVRRLG